MREHLPPDAQASIYRAIGDRDALIIQMIGRRETFANNTQLQDIVEFSGASLINAGFPSGTSIEMVSTNAGDTAAGIGAKSIRITGTDANGNLRIATYATNGTTPVALGADWDAINIAEAECGSNITPAGNVTIRSVETPTTIYEQVTAGGNRSMSARFKVPLGWEAFALPQGNAHAINHRMDVRLRATVFAWDRSLSNSFHFDDNNFLAVDTHSNLSMPYLRYPPGACIKISVKPSATAGSPRCDVTQSLLLVRQ